LLKLVFTRSRAILQCGPSSQAVEVTVKISWPRSSLAVNTMHMGVTTPCMCDALWVIASVNIKYLVCKDGFGEKAVEVF